MTSITEQTETATTTQPKSATSAKKAPKTRRSEKKGGSARKASSASRSPPRNLFIASGYVGADRLGLIGKYYPYGQEKPSATTNGIEKFTKYFRDSEMGLDYASISDGAQMNGI